jgi:hypothetical protein
MKVVFLKAQYMLDRDMCMRCIDNHRCCDDGGGCDESVSSVEGSFPWSGADDFNWDVLSMVRCNPSKDMFSLDSIPDHCLYCLEQFLRADDD